MADLAWCPKCGQPTTCLPSLGFCGHCGHRPLTPSADVPACRDEDPAWSASLAAAYPDPPEYAHPEDDHEQGY